MNYPAENSPQFHRVQMGKWEETPTRLLQEERIKPSPRLPTVPPQNHRKKHGKKQDSTSLFLRDNQQ